MNTFTHRRKTNNTHHRQKQKHITHNTTSCTGSDQTVRQEEQRWIEEDWGKQSWCNRNPTETSAREGSKPTTDVYCLYWLIGLERRRLLMHVSWCSFTQHNALQSICVNQLDEHEENVKVDVDRRKNCEKNCDGSQVGNERNASRRLTTKQNLIFRKVL